MAKIKVNSTAMRNQAKKFRNIAESLKTTTGDITAEVENLDVTWKGDASRAFIDSFTSYSRNFTVIYNTLLKYADFLDDAARKYDDTERANTVKKA